MDTIVQSIQSLSDGAAADLPQLLGTLKQGQETIKKSNVQQLDQAMESLDFSRHSLGVLFILCTKADIISAVDVGSFFSQTQHFMKDCNSEQIKLAPHQFTRLCRKFLGVAIDQRNYMGAVKPLKLAVSKFSPSIEFLTPVHVDFVQICLLAKCYHVASDVISKPIFDIDPKQTALVPQDLLRYFYYTGMLHIGLKQYNAALDSLQMCVTAPAAVLSEVVVAAYKKFVLVSLIVHGQLPALPKFVSPVVQRQIKATTTAYHDFATTFKGLKMEELQKVASENTEVFTKDSNFGLVKQCLEALKQRRIERLTSTYLTLSLQDIAQNAGLADDKEAERYVLAMVKAGTIFAKIDQRDGMVIFEEDSALQASGEMLQCLNSEINTAVGLNERLQDIDAEVSKHSGYLSKQNNTQGKTPGGAGWNEDVMF